MSPSPTLVSQGKPLSPYFRPRLEQIQSAMGFGTQAFTCLSFPIYEMGMALTTKGVH